MTSENRKSKFQQTATDMYDLVMEKTKNGRDFAASRDFADQEFTIVITVRVVRRTEKGL